MVSLVDVLRIGGGIGIFLLGMLVMSDGLRAAAGDALRDVLRRFTGRPISSALTGAAATAALQSSSATTVATIGFVSAGILTLPQAVGIVLGANIGTTTTGWLVALLGFKLRLGMVMPLLVAVGALMRLMGRQRSAQVGMAIAGFGLIFVAIGVMQEGMSELAGTLRPDNLPMGSTGDRMILLLSGLAFTVLTQSSSAGIVTTLTALDSGAIEFAQATNLVIGMDIGTTITAAVASIGASVDGRRTALAHVGFNLTLGIVVFSSMPLILGGIESVAGPAVARDPEIGLVAFHTGINMLGAALVLPLARRYAKLLTRLVPERSTSLTRHLAPMVVDDPSFAVPAARRTTVEIMAELVKLASEVLRGQLEPAMTQQRMQRIQRALEDTRQYLESIPSNTATADARRAWMQMLYVLDHLRRTTRHLGEQNRAHEVHDDGELNAAGKAVAATLDRVREWLMAPTDDEIPAAIADLAQQIQQTRKQTRPATLQATAEGTMTVQRAMDRLDGYLWLERIAYHTWRSVDHLQDETSTPETHTEQSLDPDELVD